LSSSVQEPTKTGCAQADAAAQNIPVRDGVRAGRGRRFGVFPKIGAFIQSHADQAQSRMRSEIRFALLYDESLHCFTCRVSPGNCLLYSYHAVSAGLSFIRRLFSSRIQGILISPDNRTNLKTYCGMLRTARSLMTPNTTNITQMY
jgi:hypothetical protein